MTVPAGTKKIIYDASGEPGVDFHVEITAGDEGQSAWDFVDQVVQIGMDAIQAHLESHPTWGEFGGGMQRRYETNNEDTSWPEP